MPVRRTPRRRKRDREVTEAQKDLLFRGYVFIHDGTKRFFEGSTSPTEPDPKKVGEFWDEVGDQLLNDWIESNPGTRPYGWWVSSACPEPRRRLLAGKMFPGRLNCGVCTSHSGCEFRDPPIVETQAAYLDRHGLLTDAEREVLGNDFPREENFLFPKE